MSNTLVLILLSGLAMSALALTGSLTLIVREETFNRLVLPLAVLVPFAAGNFIYIAATDLLPEITTSPAAREKAVLSAGVGAGLGVLFLAALVV